LIKNSREKLDWSNSSFKKIKDGATLYYADGGFVSLDFSNNASQG
jgi:hypothetical protein